MILCLNPCATLSIIISRINCHLKSVENSEEVKKSKWVKFLNDIRVPVGVINHTSCSDIKLTDVFGSKPTQWYGPHWKKIIQKNMLRQILIGFFRCIHAQSKK